MPSKLKPCPIPGCEGEGRKVWGGREVKCHLCGFNVRAGYWDKLPRSIPDSVGHIVRWATAYIMEGLGHRHLEGLRGAVVAHLDGTPTTEETKIMECPICGREMEQESVFAIPGFSAIKERNPGPGNELRSSLPSVPVTIEPYKLQVVFVCPGGHT